MSNHIGKKLIKIPDGFKFTIIKFPTHNSILITSPNLTTFQFSYPSYFSLSINNNNLTICNPNTSSESKALWGTLQSKISSIILGLSEGFTRKLSLKGVGFRFQTTDKPNVILLFIGFTNPILIEIPSQIQCKLINHTTLEGKSNDLNLLSNTFNKIKNIKPSEKDKYKNKGIIITG